ncbi:hypothetical protein [Brevibacterium otitidis]|uniref:DUF4926 domain-containing protein n=1 Tax=Brevibacterium otitidis TaxID=53364 RepID=A0ABV5X121_9MICO|nr:hypothetical protein GCM10023233_04670 [Brevibacterium otitidis]
MTEFKIGDIVRIMKGEPDKPGYRVEVRTVTEGISESPEVNLHTLGTFENAGWTVELIERPAPTLSELLVEVAEHLKGQANE